MLLSPSLRRPEGDHRGTRLTVSVIVPPGPVPAWQADAIAALRGVPELDVRVTAAAAAPSWRPLSGIARRIAGRAVAPVSIDLEQEAVAADLVLDFTRTAITTPPGGVWTFAVGRGDDRIPFLRDVGAGARTVDVALLRTTSSGLQVLRQGRFPVTRWHPTTVRLALREAARWPAELAGAIAGGIAVPARDADLQPRTPASWLHRLRFAATLVARLASAFGEYAFAITEWNVGFARGTPRDVLAGRALDVHWLPRPRRWTFLADPFLVERDGRRVLFAEEYDYRRDRGVLEAIELDGDWNIVHRERILDLATHLSYPFPIELDGQLYLVPENCAAGEVALYRCLEYPWRWERAAGIMPDVDGVDTSVFQHEGRWWAFATRYGRGSMVALHGYYADAPRGPWTAHPLNPLVVDVGGARPAGAPFVVDGTLYRPAQDCSRTYGGAVVIARIDELSPVAYREAVVARLDARRFGRYSGGVHTLGFTGSAIVVDGKHEYWDIRKPVWAIRRLVERAIGAKVSRR